MTTTRYFEVITKVVGCGNCPEVDSRYKCCDFGVRLAYLKRRELYKQNKDQLTPSCPMWNETKESETK